MQWKCYIWLTISTEIPWNSLVYNRGNWGIETQRENDRCKVLTLRICFEWHQWFWRVKVWRAKVTVLPMSRWKAATTLCWLSRILNKCQCNRLLWKPKQCCDYGVIKEEKDATQIEVDDAITSKEKQQARSDKYVTLPLLLMAATT